MEATQRIRIAVADDSTIYRNNVRLMLRLQNDMAVVAEAENGWSAIEQVKAHRPDILLIDIRMPFGSMLRKLLMFPVGCPPMKNAITIKR